MDKGTTDRAVIALALVLLLLAGGAYVTDQFFWGQRRSRGERIGKITASAGDVRLKFQDDLKWSKPSLGQDLSYDDAIYTGAESTAKLTIGQSQLKLNEKSMIVLRKRQGVNFLNLTYGSVVGDVAKDEKFVIDTGDGKQLQFTATESSKIVLSRKNGRAHIDVEKGAAAVRVDGKERQVIKAERLVVHDQPTPKVKPPAKLLSLKPRAADVAAGEGPRSIEFAWAWGDQRKPTDDETYALEFSATPDFSKIHARKKIRAALETTMDVSQTLSLYYRVRGPAGELSQTERVRYVRLSPPVISAPLADQSFRGSPGRAPVVALGFRAAPGSLVEYQIARDPDFARIYREARVTEEGRETLLTGEYYLRARGDYGGLGVSPWTEPRRFDVTVPAGPQTKQSPLARVVIPNENYPDDLYAAPPERVSAYLATVLPPAPVFPGAPGAFDEVTVRVKGDSTSLRVTNRSWPTERLRPGRYEYHYQTRKEGFAPAPPRGPFGFEVSLAPPHGRAPATTGPRDAEGLSPVLLNFTPLLFARSYDVQIATKPDFRDSVSLKTSEPRVRARLGPGRYLWRARALDERDQIISDYSAPAALVSLAPAPPPLLLTQRAPSSTLSTTVDPAGPLSFVHRGWYAWLGTGESFMKYNQSIEGRASADYHQVTPGGQYVEVGHGTLDGIGGALSFRSTPGAVTLDNAAVLGQNTYRWTALAIDAILRSLSKHLPGGEPVTYGVRAGVQLHRVPFLYLDSAQNVTLKAIDITTAAFGLLADWSHKRWKTYSTLRYQLPLSTQADGSSAFSIKPTFAFDGSLGASYNLTERLMIGTFMYAQWQQFHFAYAGSDATNTGYQSLFYSSLDLRLGWEF